MYRNHLQHLLIWAVLISPCGLSAENLPRFMGKLYSDNKAEIDAILMKTYTEGMAQVDANPENDQNKSKVIPLIFYHLLFTCTDATDCTRGGILEIPYFWHWVSPNPRHELLFVPSSEPLVKTEPPEGYRKYKSYADVDRTPSLYLSNLVSDSALFYHPRCGDVYTFGWCSEREMAFSCLMSLLGYEVKIKQEGIHVWSETLLEIRCEVGTERVIMKIDNTFNTVSFGKLGVSEKVWKSDFGNGTQVKWYNQKALSSKELDKVKNIETSKAAEKRISGKVKVWMNKYN